MALVVYWYDFVCFGIVGIAFCGSLWVIWRKEGGSRCDENTVYESLLVARPEIGDVYVSALPKGHVSTSQLWTSCWRGVHPSWLLATRFISFLVMAGFLTWDVLDWNAESVFMFYTEWTFALVLVYFALGTIVSGYGCWLSSQTPLSENGTRDEFLRRDFEESGTTNSISYREKVIEGTIKLQSHYAEEEFQRRAGFWGYLMQVAYQTCGGAVILTDIVFWCVIVPFLSIAHVRLNLMGCMHALNAFFLLLDTSLNSLPFPWFRIAYFIIWSCVYVVFQWVIHACGFTWWPYPFIELDTPWAPLWYFSFAVLHIPCYGIYALIIKAKNSILPRLFPHSFIRSR
ncbi:uncharacterized protein LOC121263350 isoform X2 [Juglans microcarpa x Juglans regia]|uniref:uncharacterized protein LOC121263350 isoform X2 n=1 Tax=Juglans microcarpa x Juglans regia TaxID=2249226 RepID=UPI001B7EE6CE|nr:uncharacterized protein LOC121263350 isoform X2 [Juglans microcarpa x Juglans regia]